MKKIFEEIIAGNFPNMGKEIVNQNQEAKRVSGRINPRRNTSRHIVIKPKIKDRDKILKATREKQQITYKGTPSRLSTDFTIETLKTRKEWHDIFKVIKGKNPHHEYTSQQDSLSHLMEKSKAFQTSKS